MGKASAHHAAGSRATVAISMKPKSSPWGGANQFVEQLIQHLKGQGHTVTHSLRPGVSGILLIDPRQSETSRISVSEIRKFKQRYPHVRCVHRINECDQRKGTNFMDELLREANEVADYTVFVSDWLRNYFAARWFDPSRPHQVIHNAADPGVFYPDIDNRFTSGDTIWIVTHHWADNWRKGFGIYQEVDRMIAEGELDGFALTVIGRWPKGIRWQSARTYPPVRGEKLAGLLRKNHLYLTASLWDPGPMHHVEGIQCGLPVVYHEDGGGIVDIAQRCGIGFRDDVKRALLEARDNYEELRRKALESAPSSLFMCRGYERSLLGQSE